MDIKRDLLKILKENSREFLSGEQLCRRLGVSRTAVWKQVEKLRELGYHIDARSNAGYRLVFSPDILYAHEIQDNLNTRLIGSEIKCFDELDSTNRYAREWAGKGAPGGAVVVTEKQGTGKGRMGRSWFSPKGKGLWFSIVLYPRVSAVDVSQVTLLAAAAVAGGIYKCTGLAPVIKWPNDLLSPFDYGRKLCGILTELSADMDRVNFAVLGIGLNVNIWEEDMPPDLRDVITSVALESGREVSRVQLLREILKNIDYWYEVWSRSAFDTVLQEWKKWNITLGSRVTVNTINEQVAGVAEDIGRNGALLVRLDSGELREFIAGEVSLSHRVEYKPER